MLDIFDVATAMLYGNNAKALVYSDIPDGFRLIRVKEGDTLCTITERYLGRPYWYTEIDSANQDQLRSQI